VSDHSPLTVSNSLTQGSGWLVVAALEFEPRPPGLNHLSPSSFAFGVFTAHFAWLALDWDPSTSATQ
jgi:hypothetical protein